MNWISEFIRPKIRSFVQRKPVLDNLWQPCPECNQMLYHKELLDNFYVCKHCQHHLMCPVKDRLNMLFDNGIYENLPCPKVAQDPLHFRDHKRYTDRLKEARHATGLEDAVMIAKGTIEENPLVVACFDFKFIGGSMGTAVGEALILGAETACKERAGYLVISSSGGARMQEGILSLMQMARSVLAGLRVKEEGLPFISLMTHPTTGGVAASFASLGDIILAEPGAIIGFTGPRVIQESLKKTLPEGFQTSEFQRDHGFVDLIVPRNTLKNTLSNILILLNPL